MQLRLLSLCILLLFTSVFVFAQEANLMEPDKEVAVLHTDMGNIVLEFFPNAAPKHVKNFKQLARGGFYNGTTFHRVIPGFMIQGGDPNSKDNDRSNDGTGNSGTHVPAEFNSIPHKRGILSMARSSDPNSASCQFFIVVKDSPFLDRQYSVFGRVILGMNVADKIVNAKRDDRDNPINPIKILKVTIEPRPATAAKQQ
jgi:peptidyl-prolyl cis-trans isomerase B (cyclophilin B)